MVQLLALETTAEICSVAVGDQHNSIIRSVDAPRQHNEIILELIDDILTTASILRKELDFIAFSAGPGSFTGVRLGASIAQGIALGLGIEVIPVPTSWAMAHRIFKLNPHLQNFTLRRRSRREWDYRSRFCVGPQGIECEQTDQLIASETEDCDSTTITQHQVSPSAVEVLELAIADLSKSVQPEFAHPIYVEGDNPYRQAI